MLTNAGCTSLHQKDKESILRMLCLHHCLFAVKGEIDQLCEGMANLGVLDKIRSAPVMFAGFFWEKDEEVTAGMDFHLQTDSCYVHILNHFSRVYKRLV